MADTPLGIGGSPRSGGVDVLKEALGLGSPRSAGGRDAGAVGGGAGKHGPFGARGQRVLPADFPVEKLDRQAARGTYLDILV